MKRCTRLLATLLPLLPFALASCASLSSQPPLRTVQHVDLDRYVGDWYIFAHIPYSLEKGKVGTMDHYAKRPDGRLDNVYRFRKETLDAPLEEWRGVATVTNTQTNAEWKVQFIWPMSVPYLIIDLDKNYQWAALGYPDRKLAWVLSRKPTLDEKVYQGILKRMQDQGYDTKKLVKVPQIEGKSRR